MRKSPRPVPPGTIAGSRSAWLTGLAGLLMLVLAGALMAYAAPAQAGSLSQAAGCRGGAGSCTQLGVQVAAPGWLGWPEPR
jgi:hypothetical protein